MQTFKLLFAFAVLLGVARADDVADCIKKEAWRTADMAPRGKPDVAICYHGRNSAYEKSDTTQKDADHFGGLRWTQCGNVGLDCFWMKGDNLFRYYGDSSPDSLAVIFLSDKCEHNAQFQFVNCWAVKEW